MSTLHVELAERSYPITIGSGVLQTPEEVAQYIAGNAIIVTNETLAERYAAPLQQLLPDRIIDMIVIPDGEQYKNLDTFNTVITRLLEHKAARDTTLVAVGGGVVGDLTGFVAACYQRGMPFIQVPTTLLSQVDSSVGGKTAVNHPKGKNMIGAFYQPKAVLIDTDTLSTLPAREFAAGMAEVIKYGIIYDADFFTWLENNVDGLKALHKETLQYAIQRCCAIKAEIVAQDERESGLRALLNLGHTFGHAIEAEQGYGNWLHGEAVSAGMVIACEVARHKQWLSASDCRRVEALLKAFDLPINAPKNMGYDAFMRHMVHDKKVAKGTVRFVIPTRIGAAKVTSDVDQSILESVLEQ
ncbi:3-dehydroquinate synthase [Aestuariibacter halophilus]|uniref:3-dehydroquinate synthase n=1 Tax=Fluctibacter halophilus TaxID=226011 RepID=A0ABS8GA59_9ALTE|nr:3-dehydroquinate synthase [Aestuariibacter halophilus]MCC2617383.1 3-dehydroquinate synthase [Aestuariibacter halophilus]